MRANRQIFSRMIALAGLLAAIGCGDSRVVTVEGRLVWPDGSPARELAGYTVEAAVEGSKVTARGDIDKEGRFRLGTFKIGDGAEPGVLRVCVFPPPPLEGQPPPPVKLPARYAQPENSGLTITAERGKRNEVTLTIARQ